jgi:ubiquitin C-terminal hydrolase
VIFHELIDLSAACEVRKHTSVTEEEEANENNSSTGNGIPLSRCLDKFTESEKIEDVVCPKCKSDGRLGLELELGLSLS